MSYDVEIPDVCAFSDCRSTSGFHPSTDSGEGFTTVCVGDSCPACRDGVPVPQDDPVVACDECGGEHITGGVGHTHLIFEMDSQTCVKVGWL